MKDTKLRRYIENNEEELLLNYIHEEVEKVYSNNQDCREYQQVLD